MLRRHQRLALEALDAAWREGRTRAWVVLPPGAGKTRVGLETIAVRPEAAARAVVLVPNTAIQGQWLRQASAHGLDASDGRDLATHLSVLTYQSLAVFDADAEVDDDGDETPLLSRLHDNGRALVEAMRGAGRMLLVLDECHHLLEVWGRLLGEVLEKLPDAQVLGLTATPPQALTGEQADLAERLFGETVFEATIPAVVREGDLAPFAELVWLTTPTPTESDWLASEATRFTELVTELTHPGFGSVSFLSWLDARFVSPVGEALSWSALARREPELCSAGLRMHHAGLLELPPGARLTEEHRHDPSADDWVLLVDDWLTRHLAHTGDPADDAVIEAVRRALPAVGYQWTRRGIRRGRSPVDRVLARSEAKMRAVVDIVGHEHAQLGEDMRMLVLCDHERAGATLPAGLHGVLDQQSGSAHAVLQALLGDPVTRGLGALLVTGRTVAGAPETLTALVADVARRDPVLAGRLELVPDGAVTRLEGPWTSRTWVADVTRFFEDGGARVLVGTRGLLGEGWDARRVSGLVDLTAVTTTTAVVQTRGRALRVDPARPDKVALNWSVVCVAPEHPKGAGDWDRLVRKHEGFFAVDDDGDVVDGVGHIDPELSPFAPPAVDRFDAVNARMVVRSEDRDGIRARWRVGEPYADETARTVRVVPSSPARIGARGGVPAVVAHEHGLDLRDERRPGFSDGSAPLWIGASGAALAVAFALGGAASTVAGILGVVLAVVGVVVHARALADFGRGVLRHAAEPPALSQVACAVADGLRAAGLVPHGAEAVEVEIDHEGDYRCRLRGVTEAESVAFAAALDEAVSPMLTPRYVLPRWVVAPGDPGLADALRASYGRVPSDGVVWHAVPTALGVNATRAQAYATAWGHWVGGGEAVYTGSPAGAGVLAAQQGSDPFAVSTVMRREWA
ncbi:DEAD/DEAH box helicase family protein [Nocardioides pacificus]